MKNLVKFRVQIAFLALSFPQNLTTSKAAPKTFLILNDLLTPFSHCLIHLINYKYLDIRRPEIPIVLEGHGYKRIKPKRFSRLEGNLRRRLNDSFRWKCVFHGFLFPKLPSPKIHMSMFECPYYYKEYWTGRMKTELDHGFSNLFRHRDFWIYITDRKSFEKWTPWVRGIEEVQGAQGNSTNLHS